jgi:PAS domain S-box-containing protein
MNSRGNCPAHVADCFSVSLVERVDQGIRQPSDAVTLLSEPSVQTGLLAHAVDAAPTALFVVHESGRVVGANRYACSMLGYEREDLLDVSIRELGASPELESLVAQGEAVVVSLRRRDGTTVTVRCQARPTGGDELKLLAWVAQPVSAVRPLRPPRRAARREELSARELEILQLMADGFENSQISRQLFISKETVKTHIRRLLHKLRARSRTHAVALGLRRGIID